MPFDLSALLVRAPSPRTPGGRSLAYLLSSPFAWPRDPALDALARRYRPDGPRLPDVGESLLASWSKDGPALWLATRTPGEASIVCATPQGLAIDSFERAHRRMPQTLPIAVRRPPPTSDWTFVPASPSHQSTLDGPSFGGALHVALASATMGVPPRKDTAVLAVVSTEGRLERVDELALKLAIIARGALSVARVIVAEGQAVEAQRVIAETGFPRPLEVLFASSLEGLWTLAFHQPVAAPATWSTERGLARAVQELRFVTRPTVPLPDWGPVAAGLQLLGERIGAGGPLGAEVARLHAIAARHANNAGQFVLPSDWRAHPRLQALAWLAQAVQSAADSDPSSLGDLLAFAAAELRPPLESDVLGLRLHGAVGRAETALGEFRSASERLQGTVDAWLANDEFSTEASRPLAALLLCSGICGDAVILDDALLRLESLRPALSPSDLPFPTLAAGRALVQAGQAARALSWLDDSAVRWGDAPAHVRAARARWQAVAFAQLDRGAESDAARRLATTFPDPSGQLAQLDHALKTGGDALSIARQLEPLEELVRWYRPSQSIDDAKRLAREYPY